MPEQPKSSKPVEAASAAPGERRSVSPRLARAAESGHPDVHQAIGNQYTAEQNLAAAKREGIDDPDAEQAYRAAREDLRNLGFE